MKLHGLYSIVLAAAISVAPAFSATPTIGIASAFGTFSVNNAQVSGNANVLDGAQIRTTNASSDVSLQNGASVRLATNSAGTLYRDHVVLSEGALRLDNFDSYKVEAGKYRIQAEAPGSQAIVRLTAGTVEVASLAGTIKVFNSKGAMLTRVGAGTASAFQTDQTGTGGGTGAGSGAGTGAGGGTGISDVKVITFAAVIMGATALGLGVAAVNNSNSNPSTSP